MIFEEETEQVIGYIPKLLLMEAGEGRFSSVFQHGAGMVERLPVTTPARDLITAAEIDYRPYRKEIKRLRDEHPLFAARLDIAAADFEDFVAEALLLPSMLQKIDPVGFSRWGFCWIGHCRGRMTVARCSCWMRHRNCCTCWRSRSTQVYLRNILEMAFDGMERVS